VKRWQLSDSDWHTILEAVGPLPKGARLARARRELAKCLRDYPGLRRDRAKLRAAMLRWRRIEKLAADLHAMLTDEWQEKRWRYNPLIDDAFKLYLLPSTKVITETFAMQMRLRKGKLDPGRDWVYLSLLDIWINQLPKPQMLAIGTLDILDPAARMAGSALAVVIGAHDEQRVFDGDDDDQRPEDQ
jgi:hypothetical protein